MKVLTYLDAVNCIKWAQTPIKWKSGFSAIGVHEGEVFSLAEDIAGLLSSIQLLQTPNGSFAIKYPGESHCELNWLNPLNVNRREVDFYVTSSDQANNALPDVIAVNRQAGLTVMKFIDSGTSLNQLDGIQKDQLTQIVKRLSQLHRRLSELESCARIPIFGEGSEWENIFNDAGKHRASFINEFGSLFTESSREIIERLPKALPRIAEAGGKLQRSQTICSMDMRADNIILSPDGPTFIDWQFATTAPGAVDLAALLSTSSDINPEETHEVLRIYTESSGWDMTETIYGFQVGLLTRTAFAIPVVMTLPHTTVRAQGLRTAAILRLSKLLNYFSAEILARRWM